MEIESQKSNENARSNRRSPGVRRFPLFLFLDLFLAGCLLIPIDYYVAAQKKNEPAKQSPTSTHGKEDGKPKKGFGGKYKDLNSWQRTFVDDAVQRVNLLMKTNYTSEKTYNELASSTRTTFEAVTHALRTTKLTDKSGVSLGVALDLFQSVEEIAGEKRDARGDQQYRVYFNLKPTAADTLEKSREFERGDDNTVYHFGYPINYRLRGGTPSIQISLARDGSRADVDVDYRSSKFPAAIINGHLTSANSDVRAGDNYETHVNRWSGLANWWRAIFGLNTEGTKPRHEATDNRRLNADPPLKDNVKFPAVVESFLKSWLIEQTPNISATYFGHESFSCAYGMNKDSEAGMVRLLFYRSMKDANRQLGKVNDLSDAVEAVSLWDERLQPIKHLHEDQYLLMRVPPEVAAMYDCDMRSGRPLLTLEVSKRYKDVYGAAFNIRLPNEEKGSLFLLWRREAGYWRIVSFDRADGGGSLSVRTDTDTHLKSELSEGKPVMPETMGGNRQANERIADFYQTWLVSLEYEKAMSYFSPHSYACVNAVDEGKGKITDLKKARALIKDGLQQVAQATVGGAARAAGGAAGGQNRLGEIMRPVAQMDPEMKIVKHANERAFTIVAIPDQVGRRLVCGKNEIPQETIDQAMRDNPVFGNYYASTFQLNLRGDPAYLWTMWAVEGGQWMIVYWKVIAS
jgi:hypothetical protein